MSPERGMGSTNGDQANSAEQHLGRETGARQRRARVRCSREKPGDHRNFLNSAVAVDFVLCRAGVAFDHSRQIGLPAANSTALGSNQINLLDHVGSSASAFELFTRFDTGQRRR